MSLKAKIVEDLKTAMKEKNADRLSTLRMVKASLMNREIEIGGEVRDEEIIKMLNTLVKQRRESAEQYTNAGRDELARKELEEISVIEEYLPGAATVEELESAVGEAITETGATSMKDMGNVMKSALAKLAGKTVDGKTVSDLVKRKLG